MQNCHKHFVLKRFFFLQIEQMELEVREVSGEEKSKLGHRLKAYNNEMQRFEQDLVSEDLN